MIEDGRERMNADYREMGKRLAFALDFKHYKQQDDDSPARVTPKDPGVFRITRYNAAQLSKRFPVNIRCRPEDSSFGTMAEAGCVDVQHALEDWIARPRNFYKYTRRELIWGAMVAGVWYTRVDYNPETRSASIESRDPRWIILPDGFRNPHHPKCPWIIDLDRVPTRIAQRMNWRNARSLRPDDGYDTPGPEPYQNKVNPGQVNLLDDPDGKAWSSSEMTTIARVYWRQSFAKKQSADLTQPLGPGLEHLRCDTCGWTSPPAAEMGRELNPAEVCPQCGGVAELQMHRMSDVAAYPNGRMQIIAPFQDNLGDLWNDEWPCNWPSFPFGFLQSYVHPAAYLPQSDASVHKSAVLMSNALRRTTYQQAVTSQSYFKLPGGGVIKNSRRQPFTFSPDDGNVMYDETGKLQQSQITHYPASSINTSIFALDDRIQSLFKSSDGTSDIAVAPGDSKDIPVGTIRAMTATGNVPLDEHGELLYDCESFEFGALAETLRVCAAEGMGVRHSDKRTGQSSFKQVYGAYMPRVEVVVSAGPNLDDADAAQLDTYQKLARVPPPYRRGMAKFAKVNAEVVQQIADDEAEAQRLGIPPLWAPSPMVQPGAGPGMQDQTQQEGSLNG